MDDTDIDKAESSITSLIERIQYLKREMLVKIFPSKEISSFLREAKGKLDDILDILSRRSKRSSEHIKNFSHHVRHASIHVNLLKRLEFSGFSERRTDAERLIDELEEELFAIRTTIDYLRNEKKTSGIERRYEETKSRLVTPRSQGSYEPSDIQSKQLSREKASMIERTESHQFQSLTLQITPVPSEPTHLTMEILSDYVLPFLQALIQLQTIINNIRGRTKLSPIFIKKIESNSPITIDIVGILEAIDSYLEDIIPWRRDHAQKTAVLEREKKQGEIRKEEAEADIATAKADIARIQAEADAAKTQAEAIKLEAEAKKTLAEARQIDVQSVMSILEKHGAHLPPEQKLAFVAHLIPPINTLMLSPLEPLRIESAD